MIRKKKLERAAVKGTPRIFFAVIALAFVLQGALAQTPTVTTDRNRYNRGDLVNISGSITPASGGVDVGIEVIGPGGGTVWIDTVQTNAGGSFDSQFRLDPDASFGVYRVYATPSGSSSTAWCEFTIQETVETTTETIILVDRITETITETAGNATITQTRYTFTIATTEKVTSRETVSATTSVTLTRTQTTKETASFTFTETETTTASTTVGEPIWHRIQFGLMILIPFLLVGMALGILLSRVLRRRKKAKPTIVDL